VVALRYAARAFNAWRYGAEADLHHFDEMSKEPTAADEE